MRQLTVILVTLLFASLMTTLSGQDVIRPLSPELDMVTVDPQTGFATIKWLPSASADVGSYVVYTYSNNTAFAVDTIRSPFITEYTHTGSSVSYMSVTYVVAAMDSSLNISPLSNSLSTIYITAFNDTCNAAINLSWSPYFNPGHVADSYKIWLSVVGNPAELITSLPLSSTEYSLTLVSPAADYCIYATASAGNSGLSSSNMKCVTTGSEAAPAWIKVIAIAVDKGALVFNGSYDQTTNIKKFVVQKHAGDGQAWETAGSGTGLNGVVTVSIPDADTNIISLYRISAVNNCETAVTSSPPVRNIVVASSVIGTRIDLKWNNPLLSGDAIFSVWRDIGQGWAEVASSLSDTTWSEDYSLFAAGVSSAAVAYRVTATYPEAPAGDPLFLSDITLIEATENIYMPNAFTPNDDGLNDIFVPILTFTPSKYDLRIYSRTGALLFQTGSHGTGWDGRHNDKPMPSGVYLWSLRVTLPSGITEQRTGTVTILP